MPLLTAAHHLIGAVASHLPALVDALVRASIVLAGAAAATSLMHRASAATRHVVWISSILVALGIPLLGRIAPHWDARVLPAAAFTSTRDVGPVLPDLSTGQSSPPVVAPAVTTTTVAYPPVAPLATRTTTRTTTRITSSASSATGDHEQQQQQ